MKLEIHRQNQNDRDGLGGPSYEFTWSFSDHGQTLATGHPTATHAACKRRLIAFIKKVQADDFTVYDYVDEQERRSALALPKRKKRRQ